MKSQQRSRLLASALVSALGCLPARAHDQVVLVSGHERVQGHESACFALQGDAYSSRSAYSTRTSNSSSQLKVVARFEGPIPRGRIVIDGHRSPPISIHDETFVFNVDNRRVHHMELDLDDETTLSWLSLSAPVGRLQQVSCTTEDTDLSFADDDYQRVSRLEHAGYETHRDARVDDRKVDLVVPAGTEVELVLDDDVRTDRTRAGERIRAHIAQDVDVSGRTAFEEGASVVGHVAESQDAGRFGRSRLRLYFDQLVHDDGKTDPIAATVTKYGHGSAGKQAGIIAGSAVGGAILGKAIGGDGKDAALGALVGGGIAAGSIAAKPNESVVLPAGTHLTVRLDAATYTRR